MKKKPPLLVFYLTTSLLFFTAIVSFGQSLLITPERTVSENTYGDNIILKSFSPFIGIQGIRYNGTASSKKPVLSGDYLLRLSGGGYYDPTYESIERAAIFFKATQNWSDIANGTKISFLTTNDNTTNGFINTQERMVIDQNGNVGIENSIPAAKLHINHFGSGSSPHLHLQSTEASASIIKASSINSGIWENHFITTSNAPSNLVYWYNPTFGSTPLTISGEGDIFVERDTYIGGYTNLGGVSAPKIKMKELSVTTSADVGGLATVAHGLTQSKILSVSIFVTTASGLDIPPNYDSNEPPGPGHSYFFYVSSTNINIRNSNVFPSPVASRPARILITYKE